MSRSFRETYMGKPYQALRGWHQGKRKAIAKSLRYKLKNFNDEENDPDLPATGYKKWRHFVGMHFWAQPEVDNHILHRNGRNFSSDASKFYMAEGNFQLFKFYINHFLQKIIFG